MTKEPHASPGYKEMPGDVGYIGDGSEEIDNLPEEVPALDPYTCRYVPVVHPTHVAEALGVPLDR